MVVTTMDCDPEGWRELQTTRSKDGKGVLEPKRTPKAAMRDEPMETKIDSKNAEHIHSDGKSNDPGPGHGHTKWEATRVSRPAVSSPLRPLRTCPRFTLPRLHPPHTPSCQRPGTAAALSWAAATNKKPAPAGLGCCAGCLISKSSNCDGLRRRCAFDCTHMYAPDRRFLLSHWKRPIQNWIGLNSQDGVDNIEGIVAQALGCRTRPVK
jgi:hypothetical protein